MNDDRTDTLFFWIDPGEGLGRLPMFDSFTISAPHHALLSAALATGLGHAVVAVVHGHVFVMGVVYADDMAASLIERFKTAAGKKEPRGDAGAGGLLTMFAAMPIADLLEEITILEGGPSHD